MKKIVEELKELLKIWDNTPYEEINRKLEEIENEVTYYLSQPPYKHKDVYRFIGAITYLSRKSMVKKIMYEIESFRFKGVVKDLLELTIKLIEEHLDADTYTISIEERSANQIEEFIKLLWMIRADIIFIHNDYFMKIDTSPFSVEETIDSMLNLIKGESSYFWRNMILGYFNII